MTEGWIHIKINFIELPEPDIDYWYKEYRDELDNIYWNTIYTINWEQINYD